MSLIRLWQEGQRCRRGPGPECGSQDSSTGKVAALGLGFQVCEHGVEFGNPAFSVSDEVVGQSLPVLGRRLIRNVLQHLGDLLHGQPNALGNSGYANHAGNPALVAALVAGGAL